MKSLQMLFLLVAMLMALVIADSEAPNKEEQSPFFINVRNNNSTKNSAISSSESEEYLASLRGAKSFHGHKYGREVMTCNKYPRVCRVKGSQGPDCCGKKCVNVSTDRNNCGRCGKRCKYSQMCCRGKCVNPMFDKHHCGGCGNRCNKGNSCVYGMCSYA